MAARPQQQALPREELAAAYASVARGYLLAFACYYFIITFSHPFFEHGAALWMLMGLAAVSSAAGFLFLRQLRRRTPSFTVLEVMVLIANLLFLGNAFTYLTLHPEEHHKLVHFVLITIAFGVAGPSRRVLYPCMIAAMGSLVYLAAKAGPEILDQYLFIGLAGGFVAISMWVLMRGVIERELRARLAAEALTRRVERELEVNKELSLHAQDLARREQAANRAKTEFLATITHELRTPLNGVLGMAQAMANGPLADGQRRQLETLRGSGLALLGIINNVLDISKIEAGSLDLHPSDFDLSRFVDELRGLYQSLAADRGLTFSLEIEPEAEGWRHGDDGRLRQVVNNLLANALKFTERGGIAATLGGDADGLRFTVVDTGVGIPADKAPLLFEKFVQVDASTTRRFGGAGLGLAISKEIVDQMGGEIGFTSVLGEGSRFTFTAPLPRVATPRGQGLAPATAPAATPSLSAAPVEAEPSESGAARVLVVDDNPTNRLVIKTLLEQFGIGSEAVETGVGAVAAWEASTWDVILMDIHMPEMDGLAATAAIRAREAVTGRTRTPIIAVTASVLSHETEGYLAAGMDCCVAKPIEVQRLLSAMASVMNPTAEVEDDAVQA
jgi:signal transduction histidine kinase/ActR/RegA family two-component response regulator